MSHPFYQTAAASQFAARAVSDAQRRLSEKRITKSATREEEIYAKRLANESRCKWPWPSLKYPGDEVLLPFPDDRDPIVWMESVSSLARGYAKLRGFRVRTHKGRDGLRVTRAT